MWAGPTNAVPGLWLPCDGSVISRVQFSQLFGVIGTNYGPGDELTTYNLPDFRNRSPMGADRHVNGLPQTSVSGPPTVLGGAPMHVLTPAEMPGHDHEMTHTHDLQGDLGGSTGSTHVQFLDSSVPTNLPTGPSSQQFTTPRGGGLAHNNLHPYFAITYLIYAGQ
jgi:microcystin-dependent protein